MKHKYISDYGNHNSDKELEYKQITSFLTIKLSKYVKDIVEDGVYDCHKWVEKSIPIIKKEYSDFIIYLGDDSMDDHYYKESERLNSLLNKILGKYDGLKNYLEYVAGHSFVKIGNIFIDLTLYSEGVSYLDIQKIGIILSSSNLKFKIIKR